jgi:hypothetical protein
VNCDTRNVITDNHMDDEQDSKPNGNLTIVFATLCLLMLAYVGSSGPAQFIEKLEFGLRIDTGPRIQFQQGSFGLECSRWVSPIMCIYSPLIWMDETLPTGGVLTKYWNLFSEPRHLNRYPPI